MRVINALIVEPMYGYTQIMVSLLSWQIFNQEVAVLVVRLSSL